MVSFFMIFLLKPFLESLKEDIIQSLFLLDKLLMNALVLEKMVVNMLHNAHTKVMDIHKLMVDRNIMVAFQIMMVDRSFQIVNYNNKILFYIHF